MAGKDTDVDQQANLLLDMATADPVRARAGLKQLLVESREARSKLRCAQEEIRTIRRELELEPAVRARFLGLVEEDGPQPRAEVAIQGQRYLVVPSQAVGLKVLQQLARGRSVQINARKTVLERVLGEAPPTGEMGQFVRREPGGLVLSVRGEECLVDAGCLEQVGLQPGKTIVYDPAIPMALGVSSAERGQRFERPLPKFIQIGGLKEQQGLLREYLVRCLCTPEMAGRFGIKDPGRGRILLHGPFGQGKTSLAKNCVHLVKEITGKDVVLTVESGAEAEDKYVGETRKNRKANLARLKAARDEGKIGLGIFDEFTAMGRARGAGFGSNVHADREVDGLLTDLEGIDSTDILVIATCNRLDLLDPALVSRFDLQLEIPAPDREGVREIAELNLGSGLEFSPNGKDAPQTRARCIEVLVGMLYADRKLASVVLQDAKRVPVTPRNLVSGRLIAQVTQAAGQRALRRTLAQGPCGITAGDVEEAAARALEGLTASLTVHSIRDYLPHLPQDVGVVAVERVAQKQPRRFRYLNHLSPVAE